MAFYGKVALVTGGGSGMGQLACQNFARAGKKVAALDISKEGLAKTAEGFDSISTFKVDITDYEAVKKVVDEVETNLGPIDRVFNCAAIMPLGKVIELDVPLQHKLMQINWGGLVNISSATLPRMLERRSGDFVSFASMAGIIPTLLTGTYSATKAAVVMYNETLYHENRDKGVRFASVCPPMVATPLLEQGKDCWPKMLDSGDAPIQPQDVLDAIEVSLERGDFYVYPAKGLKMGVLISKLFPSLIWKHVHKVEGF